jgi:hypothetical protein
MSVAERVYRLLLLTFPPRFRHHYQREMLLFFRDHRRQEHGRGVRFWAALCLDTARSAPGLWREQLTDVITTGGTAMKAMALLAMLVGALEVVNTGVELNAGGFVSRDLLSQVTLVLVVLAAVLLAACGIVLLRRGQRAIVLARLAGLACLGAFAFLGIARPVLSVFAMLMGIGFPLALLVFLVVRREDGLAKGLAP